MSTSSLVVAMDGPSGTGKSSVSRMLAQRLDARYLDTGAMYRIATLHALRKGVDLTDPAAIADATAGLPWSIGTDPSGEQVLLHLDSTRAVSPLRPADDSVLVDTSELGIDDVIGRLLLVVSERTGAGQ
ncbi:MAG: hypothetical protein EOP26_02285 [Rhodococcus sp. (in: high G+C Gram-positive bacteria)]|nr:MAG: hypothetical protein EOP26_02285 [Rhodococcus sp. (in: high G+C Gram-positive bacteria)]